MIGVLFVCTGNICRSPTAEGVFRHQAAAAGLHDRFKIGSAATDGYHTGEPPDARAVKIARQYGVTLDGIRARPLADDDFSRFDHIFAMDGGHLYELRERAPAGCRARIALFDDGDVPDPWYGSEKDFEAVFAQVQAASARLLEKLTREHQL